MMRPHVTRITISRAPARRRPEAGDLRRIGGVLCVRRQEHTRGCGGNDPPMAVVSRGRPVWEWVPIWPAGEDFKACDCEPGPPEDRCDRRWIRCNGRLGDQQRRVKALLNYEDQREASRPARKPDAAAVAADLHTFFKKNGNYAGSR